MSTRWNECEQEVLDLADLILNEQTGQSVLDVVQAAIVCTERQG